MPEHDNDELQTALADAGLDEPFIPLADVPRLPFVPRRRRGRKLNVATVYRWSNDRGLNGVKLRTTSFGGTRCTTATWLREFFDGLTAAATGESAAHRPSTTRRRSIAAAEAELSAAGI